MSLEPLALDVSQFSYSSKLSPIQSPSVLLSSIPPFSFLAQPISILSASNFSKKPSTSTPQDSSSNSKLEPHLPQVTIDQTYRGEDSREKRLQKIAQHAQCSKSGQNFGGSVEDLSTILSQINSSYIVEKTLQCTSSTPPLNSLERLKESSLISFLVFIGSHAFFRVLHGSLLWILKVFQYISESGLALFNFRLPKWILSGAAGKDLSASAQQADLRLRQGRILPWQRIMMSDKRIGFKERQAQYIR